MTNSSNQKTRMIKINYSMVHGLISSMLKKRKRMTTEHSIYYKKNVDG
jgi:hypothetical protein